MSLAWTRLSCAPFGLPRGRVGEGKCYCIPCLIRSSRIHKFRHLLEPLVARTPRTIHPQPFSDNSTVRVPNRGKEVPPGSWSDGLDPFVALRLLCIPSSSCLGSLVRSGRRFTLQKGVAIGWAAYSQSLSCADLPATEQYENTVTSCSITVKLAQKYRSRKSGIAFLAQLCDLRSGILHDLAS